MPKESYNPDENLVPWAKDSTGILVRAGNAPKGKQYKYVCPNCGDELLLRKGEKNRPHFAHKTEIGLIKRDEKNEYCNESYTHYTAKLLIKQVIDNWKNGIGEPPLILQTCRICDQTTEHTLSDEIDSAEIEIVVPHECKADVGLFSKGNPHSAVEIFVSNRVNDIKRLKYKIPYIEIGGFKIIENPLRWDPINEAYKDFACDKCQDALRKQKEANSRAPNTEIDTDNGKKLDNKNKARMPFTYLPTKPYIASKKFIRRSDFTPEDFFAQCESIADKSSISLPENYYRFFPRKCWTCKREILVYFWPNKKLYDIEEPDSVGVEKPETIQFREDSTVKKEFWTNTCSFCGEPQGDWLLHDKYSLFNNLPLLNDLSKDSFEICMNELAQKYINQENEYNAKYFS